jgi:hypothetical protein
VWPDEVEPDAADDGGPCVEIAVQRRKRKAAGRYDGHRSRAVTRYSCGSCATELPLNAKLWNK